MAKKSNTNELAANLKRTIKRNRIDFIPSGQAEEIVRELANKIANIPVLAIEANPFNPRTDFKQSALEELAASLRVHGLVQPITVRSMPSGRYQIISGERRWRASQLAGLEEIPAYIRAVDNDQEMLEMALVENIQRENLNPMEVAITYSRLKKECQLTDDDLAMRLGKGRATITNKLGLLRLYEPVQIALREGQISEGHAKAIKGMEESEKQKFVLENVLENDLSVRATEQFVAALKKGGKKRPAKRAKSQQYANELRQMENQLSEFFGVKVQLQSNDKGKGKITIPFTNFRKLEELIDRLK